MQSRLTTNIQLQICARAIPRRESSRSTCLLLLSFLFLSPSAALSFAISIYHLKFRLTIVDNAEECTKDLIGSLVGTGSTAGETVALLVHTRTRTLRLQSDGVHGFGEKEDQGTSAKTTSGATAARETAQIEDTAILQRWFEHINRASGRHEDETRAARALQSHYRAFICRSRYKERKRLLEERSARNSEWLKRKERDDRRRKNAPKGRSNFRTRAKETKRRGKLERDGKGEGAVSAGRESAKTADSHLDDTPSQTSPRGTRWLHSCLSPTCGMFAHTFCFALRSCFYHLKVRLIGKAKVKRPDRRPNQQTTQSSTGTVQGTSTACSRTKRQARVQSRKG